MSRLMLQVAHSRGLLQRRCLHLHAHGRDRRPQAVRCCKAACAKVRACGDAAGGRPPCLAVISLCQQRPAGALAKEEEYEAVGAWAAARRVGWLILEDVTDEAVRQVSRVGAAQQASR